MRDSVDTFLLQMDKLLAVKLFLQVLIEIHLKVFTWICVMA